MNYQIDDDKDGLEQEYSKLTKEQAKAIFSSKQLTPRVTSPWQIVKFQCTLIIGFTILFSFYSFFLGTFNELISLLLGGALGVIPSTVFIIRVEIGKIRKAEDSRGFVKTLVFAEVIKITLTLTIILLTVRLYPDLNWLFFLGMYFITLQSYWLIGFVKIKN
jgi:ATP synthase protein I